MVIVFYSMFDSFVQRTNVARWLAELPCEKRNSVARLRRPEDRLRSLIGYQLLKKACLDLGVDNFQLDALNFTPGHKPRARSKIEFSLSHSNQLVACAASLNFPVGLDTELVRPFNGLKLTNVLTASERRHIASVPDDFFSLWTRKEAVIKADGTAGLQHMREIDFGSTTPRKSVSFRGRRWHLAEVSLHAGYVTHVSTLRADTSIKQSRIELSKL